MGNKPPGKDVPSIAKFMASKKCANVIVMLGAGASTSAGIPDFRSPGSGLYANLAKLKLPYAEAVFEINFFRRNPVPFYTLARELYPGKFDPTITHSFVRLLAEHFLLLTCFTQNIDTLERRAGVPEDKIIEAHGSFATQSCIDCLTPYDDGKMKHKMNAGKIPTCKECGGLVKPDIVFFGESLPLQFLLATPMLKDADLLIVIGTSLTVHPFASLADQVKKSCPRVLINLDRVGNFGSRADDVVLLGKCDDIVKELCRELGWEEELIKVWEESKDSTEQDLTEELKRGKIREDGKQEQDVEKLTSDLGRRLALSEVTTPFATKQDDQQAGPPSQLPDQPSRSRSLVLLFGSNDELDHPGANEVPHPDPSELIAPSR